MLNISLVVADTASLTPLFSWLKGAPPGINPSSYQQKKSLGLCWLAHPWFRSSLTFSNNDTLLSRLSPPPLYGNPQWRGNLFFYLLPLLAGFLTLVSSAVEEITRFKHWLNFCPIPALAGSLLLNRPWRTRYWYFTRSHSLEHRSIIASLWVATRQFVHERSGLPPPSLVPPSVSFANTLAFPRLLAERAYQLLPQFFRSHTAFIPSSPSFSPNPHSCTFELIHFPMLTLLVAEGHPLFYALPRLHPPL